MWRRDGETDRGKETDRGRDSHSDTGLQADTEKNAKKKEEPARERSRVRGPCMWPASHAPGPSK